MAGGGGVAWDRRLVAERKHDAVVGIRGRLDAERDRAGALELEDLASEPLHLLLPLAKPRAAPALLDLLGAQGLVRIGHAPHHIGDARDLEQVLLGRIALRLGSMPYTHVPAAELSSVLARFDEFGATTLRPVFDALEGRVSFDDLRLLRIYYLSQKSL